MSYFLAPSLVSLRDEINRAHPNRDKTSDGWIGDASHAARVSDHNPDYNAGGIVRAIDVDKDGIDTAKLLRVAIACPSTEYVIWNSRIYGRWSGFKAEVYTGTNPHDKHMHISIRHTAAAATARKWGYSGSTTPAPTTPKLTQAQIDARTRDRITTLVDQVLAGSWGNGDVRIARLKASNYNPTIVQDGVNRRLGRTTTTTPAVPAKKSNVEIAREVIAGKWGNNPERGQKLLAAGYSPTAVQAEVNKLLGGARPAPVRLSVRTLAEQVIAGKWGNGPDRQRRLTAAGYDYAAVQAEVNRLL